MTQPTHHIINPPTTNSRQDTDLHAIAHQLTRMADTMQGQGMQVTLEDAFKAWPLCMYQGANT